MATFKELTQTCFNYLQLAVELYTAF